MKDLDLDALRVARAEQNGTEKAFKLGGERFALPAELPYDTAVTMAGGDMMAALEELLDEDRIASFHAQRPTVNDMFAIAEYLQTVYGSGPGESSASETS